MGKNRKTQRYGVVLWKSLVEEGRIQESKEKQGHNDITGNSGFESFNCLEFHQHWQAGRFSICPQGRLWRYNTLETKATGENKRKWSLFNPLSWIGNLHLFKVNYLIKKWVSWLHRNQERLLGLRKLVRGIKKRCWQWVNNICTLSGRKGYIE